MEKDWTWVGERFLIWRLTTFAEFWSKRWRKAVLARKLVIKMLGMGCSCMYHWLKRYWQQGLRSSNSKVALGTTAQVTAEMEQRMCQTVLNSTSLEHGYDNPALGS